ncbi:MAG: glycosyltransferase family 4 protein [Candidatus Moraniibacteriota bacterium]
MKILFISRAYPPVTGGIENQNHALSVWLKKFADVTTVANHYGKKALPLFLPYVTLRTLFTASRFDVILLGDGVLAFVGFVVKLVYPKKTIVSVIHGLDLTYQNAFYQQLWVHCFLPSLDGLIAVSKETRNVALTKNIPEQKVIVISNGVDPQALRKEYEREHLEKFLGVDLSEKQVLLTTGRLAKRKGAAWFIREVLPLLPQSVLYVLAGAGPEEENIKSAIKDTRTENQVKLLGRVSDNDRNLLINTADIFVQPNIHVPGDMEGFGIAVIEATACGRPVIASNLEGLKDAISHNESGILVEPNNPIAFKEAITDLLTDTEKRQALGKRALFYTETHYHWNIIARLYVEALEAFNKKQY